MIYIVALLCCLVVIALNVLMLSEEYDHIIPVALDWVRIKWEDPPPIKVLPSNNSVVYEEVNATINDFKSYSRTKNINMVKSDVGRALKFIGEILIVVLAWSGLIFFLYLMALIFIGIGELFGFIEELLFD